MSTEADQPINTEGDITLIVAERSSAREPRGLRVPMHTDVVNALRQFCVSTAQLAKSLTPIDYANDLSYDAQNHCLRVSTNSLVVRREDKGRKGPDGVAHPIKVETNPKVHRLIQRASALEQLDASKLESHSFEYYAVVVGSDPQTRTAFVSKWNPYMQATSGRFMTSFGDRLRKIEGPLMTFKTTFDLIVTPDSILIFNQDAFEDLFRDTESMRDRIPTWSQHVVDALPVHADTAELIKSECLRSPRLAKRVRAIYESGALDGRKFELKDLVAQFESWGIDSKKAVRDGQLVLEADEITTLFKGLDEKFWKGWFSDTLWEAGTRSKRTH